MNTTTTATIAEQATIYSLDLLPGDIVEMLSGYYAGKLVRFLGYWHPGCRVEVLETSEITDLLEDKAEFIRHGSANLSKKLINLVQNVELSEKSILETMCCYKYSRADAIRDLTRTQLLAAVDKLVS
jgi:hypothetical protein